MKHIKKQDCQLYHIRFVFRQKFRKIIEISCFIKFLLSSIFFYDIKKTFFFFSLNIFFFFQFIFT